MPQAPEQFTTARLHGERFRDRHHSELRLLDSDPRVQESLFGTTWSEDETRRRLRHFVAHWEEHGFGDYVVKLRDGEFIGSCALFRARRDSLDYVEIGYVLRPECWNRGYATEMTRAVLAIAFEALQLSEIYAATDPSNVASRRVMEKCGMLYVREYLYRGQWPSVLYTIARDGWLRRDTSERTQGPRL